MKEKSAINHMELSHLLIAAITLHSIAMPYMFLFMKNTKKPHNMLRDCEDRKDYTLQ